MPEAAFDAANVYSIRHFSPCTLFTRLENTGGTGTSYSVDLWKRRSEKRMCVSVYVCVCEWKEKSKLKVHRRKQEARVDKATSHQGKGSKIKGITKAKLMCDKTSLQSVWMLSLVSHVFFLSFLSSLFSLRASLSMCVSLEVLRASVHWLIQRKKLYY